MELEMRIVKKVAAAAMAMAVVFGAASLKPVAANAAQAGPETASVMEEENSFLSHQDEDYQNEFLCRVNSERANYGLQPLVMGDAKLTAAAQHRAEEIATVNSHVRPNGSKWYTVLSEYGVTDAASGENAAWGSVSPEEIVTAWMNSEGHRANILDPEARAMGVGYYYNSSSTWGHQRIQLFTK